MNAASWFIECAHVRFRRPLVALQQRFLVTTETSFEGYNSRSPDYPEALFIDLVGIKILYSPRS